MHHAIHTCMENIFFYIDQLFSCNNCRLDEAIRVLVESGVVFVKSAGNQGPGCKTITEPGFYDFVVAVAALQKESNTIAR